MPLKILDPPRAEDLRPGLKVRILDESSQFYRMWGQIFATTEHEVVVSLPYLDPQTHKPTWRRERFLFCCVRVLEKL